MTTHDEELRPGEEEAVGALLQDLGPGPAPSPEVRARIEAAVAAEWRHTVAARRARERPLAPIVSSAARPRRNAWQAATVGLAASVALAAAVLLVGNLDPFGAPQAAIARVSRISGAVEAGAGRDWLPVSTGQELRAGQEVVTGPGGRAALNLAGGVTLRVDADSRIALESEGRIRVERGGVYLDASPGSEDGRELVLASTFGQVRHLGTQYELRVDESGMVVAVREGRVGITGSGPALEASAGQQLAVTTAGPVGRSAVGRRDPRWEWIHAVTPPFAIEQRRLTEFLTWVTRETGRELSYDSPAVRAEAERVVLRGSVAGLSPDAALDAVMATTPLTFSVDDQQIRILGPARRVAER
ncbi:MAG: FecR domain-containing protein [Gammaproteobacteria bacterium]|nr:FecR domain-containing protein [Gammaproteobacteria bacterium]